MRKISIFLTLALFVIAGGISFASQVYGQAGSKVLMIPREGYSADLDLMIKMEVGVMNLLLKNAGFEVDIATPSGMPILGPTRKIEKVLRLSEVKLDNYVGVIIPCMAVGSFPGPAVSPEVVAIVKKALSDGKPVAANGNSPIILAEAGVLKGKKYSFLKDPLKTTTQMPRTDLRFEGAIYGGPGVVQDGKIITSGVCPTIESSQGLEGGTVKITKAFIVAIGPK
jgi:putative intracellular protease/amidase